MIDPGADTGPDEGAILGQVDFRVRTVAEDNFFDESGFTANRGAIDELMDPGEPASGPADMDDMRRRPTWMPVR